MSMSMQEIFNKTTKHLLKQQQRASNEYGRCRYRIWKDNKLLKCAVGCLIQKQFYSNELEENRVREENVINALQASQVLSLHRKIRDDQLDLLNKLQHMHDDDESGPEDWPNNLREIAVQANLKTKNIVDASS